MKKTNRFLRLYLSYFLPILFVIIFLGGGATLISRIIINSKVEENAKGQLNQITTYYETVLQEMDSLTLQFSSNSEISRRFREITDGPDVNYNEYRESKIIGGLINAVMNAHQYIYDISIYISNTKGLILTAQNGFSDLAASSNKLWIEEYMKTTHPDRNMTNRVGSFLRISRPITNSVGRQIGVIVLDLKKDVFSDNITPLDNAFLKIYSENGELLFKRGEENGRSIEFTFTGASSRWEYSLSYPKKDLYYISNTLLLYTILLTAVAVCIAFVLTQNSHKKEIAFLKSMMAKFNQNPDSEELESYTDVYSYVNDKILQTFMEGEYMRLQKETAERRALQLQLNPHFLYNTLDTIYWKAIRLSGGDNDVSRMIEQLSKLLHYSLTSGLDGIELEKELEQTRRYIMIQEYRFPSRFKYTEDIDEGIGDIKVPCLFLEPLLENVFKHAFYSKNVVNVLLEIKKRDNRINVRIFNDGKTLTEEELYTLNQDDDALEKKKSMGISNTRKRLELFYKGKASMTITNAGGLGVEVLITLPL